MLRIEVDPSHEGAIIPLSETTRADQDRDSNEGSSKRTNTTSELASGCTTGSGGDGSSSARSSPQRVQRAASAALVDTSSYSLSSHSNNNSDTDVCRKNGVPFWNLGDRSTKATATRSLQEGPAIVSASKKNTNTSSSDSGSAILKLSKSEVEASGVEKGNNAVSLSVYRKALQQAVEGLPMDEDEALALEEIVLENQRLIKFSKLL
jgi:hypothetical protein